ncbi:MAG: 4Fe-4S binding protein [Oscillospiraceae bacterium]|nr:4Fe-4S binding protein [Oscillospiraceae bacterium]
MDRIKLNLNLCKGCYLCVEHCPQGALSPSETVGAKGYPVVQVDQEKCVQCGICYTMCPDYVIEILG